MKNIQHQPIALNGQTFQIETRGPRRIYCHPYQWSFVYNIIQHVTNQVDKDTLNLRSDASGCVADFTETEHREVNALFGNLWEAYQLNVLVVCQQAFLKVVGVTNHLDKSGVVLDGRTPYEAAPLIERMMPCIDTSYIINPYDY
ncbi:MAG: hypothetical protein EOP56_15055 [Sphingobacteriales bacterium]|nr:MAG: hypothetical protein EOP56_15055 [Sphingobacteriales bacterium]